MVSIRGISLIVVLVCVLQTASVAGKPKGGSSKSKSSKGSSSNDNCKDKAENDICAYGRGYCVTKSCGAGSKSCNKKCVIGTVCQDLPNIAHGWLVLDDMADNVQGANASVKCCDGYDGSGQVTCGPAGVWGMPDSNSCMPEECPAELPTDANGEYVTQSDPATFPSGTAVLKCNPDSGFCDAIPPTITCTSDGSWSEPQGICTGVEHCPSGWTYYQNSCYLLGSQSGNAVQAQAYCKEQNSSANLVFIETFKENEYVRGQIISQGLPRSYWIGINDEDVEGTFVKTEDPTQMAKATFWARCEPNNAGSNQHCVNYWAARNWYWDDVTCSNAAYYPLCEIELC